MTPVVTHTSGAGPSSFPSELSFDIRRSRSTVVVTVRGPLDRHSVGMAERLLSDLVEGQGNRTVVVDLAEAWVVDPDALTMFQLPAEQARRRGAAFALLHTPSGARMTLERLGVSNFVD